MVIDINCDCGESFGVYTVGQDAALLDFVSSANIACGFHAGDPTVMRATVALAAARGVAIGAHPGYLDLQGFGRRKVDATPQEVYDLVVYQIGALAAFARTKGVRLHHVKPHGALYNTSATHYAIAEAIAEAIHAVDADLTLYALAGSRLVEAGRRRGLRVASEVFADRTYQADGTLTPRSAANAMLHEEGAALSQVLRMITEGKVMSTSGVDVQIKADTVCIHGDGPSALAFAKTLRQGLAAARIDVRRTS